LLLTVNVATPPWDIPEVLFTAETNTR